VAFGTHGRTPTRGLILGPRRPRTPLFDGVLLRPLNINHGRAKVAYGFSRTLKPEVVAFECSSTPIVAFSCNRAIVQYNIQSQFQLDDQPLLSTNTTTGRCEFSLPRPRFERPFLISTFAIAPKAQCDRPGFFYRHAGWEMSRSQPGRVRRTNCRHETLPPRFQTFPLRKSPVTFFGWRLAPTEAQSSLAVLGGIGVADGRRCRRF